MIRYTRTASNDSDEIGIEGQGQSAAGASGGQAAGRRAEPSGHHEPGQRRAYLILLALSVGLALAGIGLILLWMLRLTPTPGLGLTTADELANSHPVLMFVFMVSLNMYAVLIYRTHYQQPKDRLKWAHAIVSGLNIVMSLLGVLAMYKAHLLLGIPNFYSLHSWIGAMTNGFYLLQFSMGFVAFLKPGMALHRRQQLMPWHRIAGAMILVLAATAAITGITELVIFKHMKEYSKFATITFVANLAGVCVILMTAISIYLLTATKYLRPTLPEEEPLKR